MAQKIAAGLGGLSGVRLPWPTEANEVFVVLPDAMLAAIRQAGYAVAPWSSLSLPPGFVIAEGEAFVRLVASFASRPEDVDGLIAAARAA